MGERIERRRVPVSKRQESLERRNGLAMLSSPRQGSAQAEEHHRVVGEALGTAGEYRGRVRKSAQLEKIKSGLDERVGVRPIAPIDRFKADADSLVALPRPPGGGCRPAPPGRRVFDPLHLF